MLDEREPTLDEILSEPIIRQVMKADGVVSADIRRLYRSLESDGESPPAFMCAQLLEACRPQV
ncbi:hypothetical protein SAMN04488498_11214 [Mesorhizobium albiziae]|uniref:Uncharacterized protein n=1 Tax=Neomesorhizobium albiziae TaxID=335020 RepID=A0A1I4C549_9HYPH|nr:hypothetical protein [Mesorhizobium albiziae]GLS29419.1 hypothetical protein GCM10007937_11270 [Mesorhizobium albiziae]SFK76212.1 hypothetical protein SAMN04488498_11214 [Mesorhizobium albiziae]